MVMGVKIQQSGGGGCLNAALDKSCEIVTWEHQNSGLPSQENPTPERVRSGNKTVPLTNLWSLAVMETVGSLLAGSWGVYYAGIYICRISDFCVAEVNDFLKVLDQRADQKRQLSKRYIAERKQRRDGVAADTSPPADAPKWAVDKEWRKKGTVKPPFLLVQCSN